jgi:hypothetical protein
MVRQDGVTRRERVRKDHATDTTAVVEMEKIRK